MQQISSRFDKNQSIENLSDKILGISFFSVTLQV